MSFKSEININFCSKKVFNWKKLNLLLLLYLNNRKILLFLFSVFWKKGPTEVIMLPCTLAKSNQISIQPYSSPNSPVGLVKTALYPLTLGETAVNSDLPSCERSMAPVESGTFPFPALWAAWKEVWTYFSLLIKLYFPDSSWININKFECFCDSVWNYIIWCTIWGLWDYDFKLWDCMFLSVSMT